MPDDADNRQTNGEGEAELRAILHDLPATRALAHGRLTSIPGGLSNRAWRLEADGEAWFVRLGHPDAARLGVDRRSECVVLQAVSAAGLAPAVRACVPERNLLVVRYVEGITWQAADVAVEANLQRVAERLRFLHELPVPAGVQQVDYARQARHLEAGLPVRDALAEVLQELANRAFVRLAGRGGTKSLCHNDLHHLNLLGDGARLWLVDWEYAGRGDPLLDVAGFLGMHELGPRQAAYFLKHYGRLGPADRDCLDAARWVFDYVQWLWYRSRFPDPASGEAWRAKGLAQRLLRCNN